MESHENTAATTMPDNTGLPLTPKPTANSITSMPTAWTQRSVERLATLALLVATGVNCGSALGGTVSIKGEFLSYTGPAYEVVTNPFSINSTLNTKNLIPDPATVMDVPGVGRVGIVPSQSINPVTTSVEFGTTFNTPNLSNVISFTGLQNVDAKPGVKFLWGIFRVTNGTWFDSVRFAKSEFTFRLTTVSTDPALDGIKFEDTFVFYATPGSIMGSPVTAADNADFFYLKGRPDLGSMRAFEVGVPGVTNTGEIWLEGKIGSLIPTGFVDLNPDDGVFLSPSILGVAAVPEPEIYTMMGIGLALVSWAARRRRRQTT